LKLARQKHDCVARQLWRLKKIENTNAACQTLFNALSVIENGAHPAVI